jgi:membrane dipeptidase
MSDAKVKRYSGYRPFQYLETGVDYRNFEIATDVGRVESYQIPLSELEEKRVNELYSKYIVIALHDHALRIPTDLNQFMEWSKQGRTATAYEGPSISCIDVVFDNLMDDFAYITSKGSWRFEDVICDLGMRLSDITHQDLVTRCESVEDILIAHDEGKIALIPSIECSTPIEKELDRIDVLYGLGIRMMGITYSESNMLGSGLKEEDEG